jgi:PAS domain S-box-containing protein
VAIVQHERFESVERQLAVAQEITHIGSWEWDLGSNVVRWSDELYRIYGYEPRSRPITFEFFLSRLHPEDRERIQGQVGQALERGSRFAYPERIVRPDGSIRYLDTVGEAMRADDGRVTGLIGTCRDITEDRARDEMIRLQADIVHNMQIALGVWEMADPNDVTTLRLVSYNPAAEGAARRSLEGCIGRPFREIFPYGTNGEVEALLVSVARTRRVEGRLVERSNNPKHASRAISAKAFPLAGGRIGLAAEDVTEVTRARRLQDAEHEVLEKIATGATLGDVLGSLVLAVEEHSPPGLGAILLVDVDGLRMRRGAAPSLPQPFVQALETMTMNDVHAPCVAAARLKKAVFVEDIEADPECAPCQPLAREHGLRSCWSTPIVSSGGRVLGTFSLLYREPRKPTDEDLQIIERATYLARIAIERKQLEERLRALSAHAETVREDERTGIAREIHEVLGQALTALKMDVAWLARRVDSDSPSPKSALLDKLHGMSEITDDVIKQVRRISSELRPGVLDDLGLVAAVDWQAQEFESRTSVVCSLNADLGNEPISRELSTAVFRIFQEALTNIARHAEAERVDIDLVRDGADLRLIVHDDGKGIDPVEIDDPESLGLLGIRERARHLGGSATIERAPEGGTRVSLQLPIAKATRGAT